MKNNFYRELLQNPSLKRIIEKNVAYLKQYQTDFYYLITRYTEDRSFIKFWRETLPKSKKKVSLSITFYEYIHHLLPVGTTSMTALFGALLGLSTFERLSNILANRSVVLITFILSLIITILSILAVYRELKVIDDKTNFINWFYLSILDELLNLTASNDFLKEIKDLLHFKLRHFFEEISDSLGKSDIPDIKKFEAELIESLQKIYDDHTHCLFHHPLLQRMIQRLNKFIALSEISLEKEKINLLNDPSKQEREIIYQIKIKNKIYMKIKDRFSRFKKNFFNNRVLWETTIGSIAMVAGFSGVTFGTAKTVAIFSQRKIMEHTIASDITLTFVLILMLTMLITNFYCRWKGQIYVKNREQLLFKQVQIVNGVRGVISILCL